jgi:hypothetical protein
VIPYDPETYALLATQFTPERVLALFAHRRAAKVMRDDLPRLRRPRLHCLCCFCCRVRQRTELSRAMD